MNPLNFSGRAKTPLILQTETAECGLACLAMVAGYYGYRIDLASLRLRFPISSKGITLAHLMDFASRMEFSSRPLKVDLEHLDMLRLPTILHWDFSHFVVLVKVSARNLTIHDPARGVCHLGWQEFSGHYTGVALELSPNDTFTRGKVRRRVSLGLLCGRIQGMSGALIQIFYLAIALEIFTIVGPFYLQWVVDSVIVTDDRDLLTVLGLGFTLLLAIRLLVGALRSWVVMVLGTTLNLKLLNNLLSHLLGLPMDFFVKRNLGDLSSRFESLNVIQRTLTGSFIEAVIDGVTALATLTLMAVYSLKLFAVAVSATLLYALLRYGFYHPQWRATEEQIHHAAKQQTHFLETLRGIQSIKLFNRQLQRRTVFQNLAVDNFNASIRLQKLSILYHAMNGLLFGLEHVAVVWIGALLVLQNDFSVGMLFAFMSYKDQFSNRIGSVIDKLIEFNLLSLHLERVADIALTELEETVKGVSTDASLLDPSIEVYDLGFRYSETDPWVLHGVNLSISAGESVAIIGPSGCGKTTLMKILLGLLRPSCGEIRVGGKDLSSLSVIQYRNIVGAVMQDDMLFGGSIAENISFFDSHPDQESIIKCAQLASIHEDIEAMPMGYNTLIGDMGVAFSGGQQQRLLLARALYKQPKILLLDEATSHLDIHREKSVNQAIRELKLTRIIIAHRPETIASADRVILLGQPYGFGQK